MISYYYYYSNIIFCFCFFIGRLSSEDLLESASVETEVKFKLPIRYFEILRRHIRTRFHNITI